jgi:hypothetical protein
MRRTNKLSAAQRERRRTAYAHPLRERLQQNQQPADPVVVRLFNDLQLAEWTRHYNRKRTKEANQYEREAWEYLLTYLTTLERPNGLKV